MKYILSFLTLTILLSACCKDHSDIIPGQDFIPEAVLAAIKANGQVIYEGYHPPALSGKYFMSPVVLVSSNFNDPYFPGHQFVDAIIGFSDFNPDNLTLKVSVEEGDLKGAGYGSFISGEGNDFTIYVKLDSKDDKGHQILQTDLFSGTLEPGGIRNLQRSSFMVEDNGDPNNEYINNGQGRLAIDQDGFSEKI